jgi:hypothetical protein
MTFGALFTQLTGFFEKRFQITYFLPSIVFWGLLVVVWFAGRGDASAAARLWEEGTGTAWVVRLVGFFAWITLFANVLASQSMALLRLYEGYWSFPGGSRLRGLARGWHQKKLRRITNALAQDEKQYHLIYFGYPLNPAEVMPTQLGNILKNAELYSYDRYEIDAVLIWPRLYNLFPQKFADEIVELRTALDFMLVISGLSVAFAFVSGTYLLFVGASVPLFLLCFGGGLVVAWVAYHGALGSAVLYAQQIKSAFDLYRNELLKQMRVRLPESLAEERARWAELCKFLYRVTPPAAWDYTSDEDAAATAAARASIKQ